MEVLGEWGARLAQAAPQRPLGSVQLDPRADPSGVFFYRDGMLELWDMNNRIAICGLSGVLIAGRGQFISS